MTASVRLVLAGLLAGLLAACATQPPPPDYSAPRQRLDAKTTLENAPRR